MDFRSLGASGLNVPAIGLGTANFRAGANPPGGVGEKLAARMVDIALERDAAFFDTGNADGASEEVLGKALAKRRGRALIAAKAGLRSGPGPNDCGASRQHLIEACERSLRRLGTDHVDLYQIQTFDPRTPVEETLSALDALIQAGKVRYIGASNYAGWQLMKSLAAADRLGRPRFVAHRIAWSLAMRDAEWELSPLAADQNVATLVRSPLAGGLLGGKQGLEAPGLPNRQLSDILDCLREVAAEAICQPAQVALAWLLQRPTVSSLFTGATSVEQLEANLDAVDLRLSGDQLTRLDDVSARPLPYPHSYQQSMGAERFVQPGGGANVRVDKAPYAERQPLPIEEED